jgi:acyl-CoA dehydrogenase
MTYRAPVEEMVFTIRHVAGFDGAVAEGLYGELSADVLASVLEEAGKFANDRIAPLNHAGDQHGAKLADGKVTTPPGYKDTYKAWAEAGWGSLAGPVEWGGQGLPMIVQAACIEMWNASCMAFALNPLLTAGAIDALSAHASEDLQKRYLTKLVSGEWTGTMNLTEAQAGSDLNALRTRAEPRGDGTYRIKGQKIFITYGEHDAADNILHLVLARVPDAPPGTRGISLFLVPKFLVNDDGTLGERNDVHCASIEHKLGIHGSPTCVMVYGDRDGAVGYLVGQENRGLNCMFTMMNSARLAVGLQGVAIADRAFQQALAYANERRQGRASDRTEEGMSPIAAHPDVQRMLLTMKSYTAASRAICFRTAAAIDRGHLGRDAEEKRRGTELASLLTPVAKAFSSDIGVEVASIGVQVHGGMGFIEETGAAQHLRDARIAPIYEGTNGIQAIDLVMRKLPLSGGETIRGVIAGQRKTAGRALAADVPELGSVPARLRECAESLDKATSFMLKTLAGNAHDDALAGAAPYLRLFGLAEGLAGLTEAALMSHSLRAGGDTSPAHTARIALARFFAENIASGAAGLEQAVTAGAASVNDAPLALAS